VVAVNEGEIDASLTTLELAEDSGEQLVRVAGVEADVRQFRGVKRRRDEIERMHLGRVVGDRVQAATFRGTDLDRQLRLQLADDANEGRALSHRHLPLGVFEEVDQGGNFSTID
jgi:hypothetical protein